MRIAASRLSVLLSHLYVLIPVLDDAKHYFVGEEEIDKLLNRGEGWLDQHPAKELIVRRYLRRPRCCRVVAFPRGRAAGGPTGGERSDHFRAVPRFPWS